MALQLNRVMLAGNLTRDPEVRMIGGDRSVASFSLAINRRYKGQDGELKEEVTFVDCEAWGRTAELVGQYLVKGRACFIEGRLRLDSWDDKKDGTKRSKLKVVADNVQFVDSNRDRSAGGGADGGEAGDGGHQQAPAPAPARASKPAAAAPQPAADDEPPF